MKKTYLSMAIDMVAIIFCIIGCSKNNEQTLAGGTTITPITCDTVNMKYATNVVPILQANCYSCHATGSNGGGSGISLDSYTNLKKWASNGYLVGTITHASGFVAMPYGRAKLDSCTINKIISWVKNGALNN